jgi:cytidylate kinase
MTKRERTVIAIDGPGASGKSTVAKAVAEALEYNYVDTGAMYRAVAWKCLQEKIDPGDSAAIVKLIGRTDLKVDFTDGKSRVLVDGSDPGSQLRSEAVSAVVSEVSAVPKVRERLVSEQRAMLEQGDVVMEGRDIGTVVFPDTPFKFFIDAHADVRAERRASELQASREQIARNLARRDRHDSTRQASPLKVADDAVRIDSSDKTVTAVVDLILKHIRTRHFSK